VSAIPVTNSQPSNEYLMVALPSAEPLPAGPAPYTETMVWKRIVSTLDSQAISITPLYLPIFVKVRMKSFSAIKGDICCSGYW
jgi:hypothetical protein